MTQDIASYQKSKIIVFFFFLFLLLIFLGIYSNVLFCPRSNGNYFCEYMYFVLEI